MSPRRLLAGRGSASGAVDAALLVLRVFAGVAFVMHRWGKVADVRGFAAAHDVPVVLGTAAAYVQFIGGRLDVALDPRFADTRLVYLSYAEPGEGRTAGTAVARRRAAEAKRL